MKLLDRLFGKRRAAREERTRELENTSSAIVKLASDIASCANVRAGKVLAEFDSPPKKVRIRGDAPS